MELNLFIYYLLKSFHFIICLLNLQIETCRKVENVLKRFDRKGTNIRVLPFHAALAKESRLENMKEFMNSFPGENSLFLVCTDRYRLYTRLFSLPDITEAPHPRIYKHNIT